MKNTASKQYEAEVGSVARKIANGIAVEAGDGFQWETRLGDEGPDSWTRGESEATAQMIADAIALLGVR